MLSSLSESSVKETSSAFASSTSPDFRKEILDAFESTDMDSQVVETIAALCHTFALSPSDLFYKWDAFTANQTVSMDDLRLSSAANRNDVPAQLLGSECPTLEQLAQLRQILGRDQQKKLAKTLAGNNNSNNNSINNNTQMSFRHHSASQQQSQLLPSLNHKSLMALIQAGTPPNSSATTTSTSGSISQLASHPQKKIVPTQSSMANTNSRQPKTPNPKSRSSLAGRAGSLDILSSPPFGQSAFSPPVPLSGKLIGEERSLHDTIDGQSQSSSPSIKFSDRPDRAKVMDSFNKHIQFKSVPPSDPVQCELSLVPGQQTDGYRYMYEKLTEKGELLDAQIEYFSHIIANAYHLELTSSSSLNSDETKAIKDTPMEDPMSLVCSPVQPRNEPGLVIGRICCDSLQDGVGLNSQSVMLECSRDNGGGIRVKVDLNGVLDSSQQCTLFPGQIVGLIATNPSGRQLHASRIIYPTFPPRPTTNLSEIKSMYPAENGANQRAINVVVASGPFTLIGNLLYESLESLVVDVIEDDPPDVVILLGPFVDLDHPLIASGQVLEDVDDIFRNQIAKRIDRMRAARPGLQVILIPSIRDACSEWIAFPQPPLASGISPEAARSRRMELGLASDLQNGVYLFPNPVQFRLNEIVFAVSTNDILFDLAGSQFISRSAMQTPSKSAPSSDHLDRPSISFQHILRHRSFYPMFPSASNACLDATRALAMTTENANASMDDEEQDQESPGPLVLQVIPDILIVPSRLQCMTRNVQDCLCINPGAMIKGRSGGTFVRLCIHPFRTDSTDTLESSVKSKSTQELDTSMETDDDIELEHAVVHRTAVSIRRI